MSWCLEFGDVGGFVGWQVTFPLMLSSYKLVENDRLKQHFWDYLHSEKALPNLSLVSSPISLLDFKKNQLLFVPFSHHSLTTFAFIKQFEEYLVNHLAYILDLDEYAHCEFEPLLDDDVAITSALYFCQSYHTMREKNRAQNNENNRSAFRKERRQAVHQAPVKSSFKFDCDRALPKINYERVNVPVVPKGVYSVTYSPIPLTFINVSVESKIKRTRLVIVVPVLPAQSLDSDEQIVDLFKKIDITPKVDKSLVRINIKKIKKGNKKKPKVRVKAIVNKKKKKTIVLRACPPRKKEFLINKRNKVLIGISRYKLEQIRKIKCKFKNHDGLVPLHLKRKTPKWKICDLSF